MDCCGGVVESSWLSELLAAPEQSGLEQHQPPGTQPPLLDCSLPALLMQAGSDDDWQLFAGTVAAPQLDPLRLELPSLSADAFSLLAPLLRPGRPSINSTSAANEAALPQQLQVDHGAGGGTEIDAAISAAASAAPVSSDSNCSTYAHRCMVHSPGVMLSKDWQPQPPAIDLQQFLSTSLPAQCAAGSPPLLLPAPLHQPDCQANGLQLPLPQVATPSPVSQPPGASPATMQTPEALVPLQPALPHIPQPESADGPQGGLLKRRAANREHQKLSRDRKRVDFFPPWTRIVFKVADGGGLPSGGACFSVQIVQRFT